jgi:hypothetical protein
MLSSILVRHCWLRWDQGGMRYLCLTLWKLVLVREGGGLRGGGGGGGEGKKRRWQWLPLVDVVFGFLAVGCDGLITNILISLKLDYVSPDKPDKSIVTRKLKKT